MIKSFELWLGDFRPMLIKRIPHSQKKNKIIIIVIVVVVIVIITMTIIIELKHHSNGLQSID
jgi:hypothetical protein